MEMAMFEILFNQGSRLESTCVSIEWLGWLQLEQTKRATKVAKRNRHGQVAAFEKASPSLGEAALYH
jgi:hypothetical protein